jgi:hypothetical protein
MEEERETNSRRNDATFQAKSRQQLEPIHLKLSSNVRDISLQSVCNWLHASNPLAICVHWMVPITVHPW